MFLFLLAAGAVTAAPEAERDIVDLLPGLRANPTPTAAEIRANPAAADAKFHDWIPAHADFKDWIGRDPLAPWVALWKCRSRVPDADWQLLQRELHLMARFHATPQYKLLVQEWEPLSGNTLFHTPDTFEAWQKVVNKAPRKMGALVFIASENVFRDWVRAADFLWVQPVDAAEVTAARKAELVDLALRFWAEKKGSLDEPLAWLQENGRTGEPFNLPAAWMAVDVFPTKPDVAAKLLARIDNAVMKQVAIHAIAAQAAKPESLEPLRPLADATTWKLITLK